MYFTYKRLKAETKATRRRVGDGDVFLSHKSSNSAGVGILFFRDFREGLGSFSKQCEHCSEKQVAEGLCSSGRF